MRCYHLRETLKNATRKIKMLCAFIYCTTCPNYFKAVFNYLLTNKHRQAVSLNQKCFTDNYAHI